MAINLANPVNWQSPYNRGLVSWYRTMPGGGRGTGWRDLTGKNPGTLTNAPTWQSAAGRQGGHGSLLFDGSSTYVDVPGSSSLQISSAITLMAWFNLTNALSLNNYGHIVTKAGGGSWTSPYAVWALRVQNDGNTASVTKLGSWINDGGVGTNFTYGITQLNASQWYHAVYTFDGATASLYLNGVLENSTSISASITTNSFNMYLGCRTGAGEVFPGKLDDIRIYNRCVSANEIKGYYYDSQTAVSTLNRLRNSFIATPPAAATGGPWPFFMDEMSGGMQTLGMVA